MMDWTDRHCRYLHRLMSRHTLLYTEMVTAPALVRGGALHLLQFNSEEHPVALQLGGSDPAELAKAARLGQDAGYDEINLNVGCPSDRVQSGTFGAVLMKTPALVAECCAAMRAAVDVEVTVKCRIGVDDQVPTWNYVACHLRGRVRRLPDADLRGVLERLSDDMERRLLPKPIWKIDKVSDDVLSKMLRQIVPIAMDVDDLDGTWKLGQNKADTARLGASEQMRENGFGLGQDWIADLMKDPPV